MTNCVEGHCEYSTGCCKNLRKDTVKFLKICGDKASAPHRVEKFMDKFVEVFADVKSDSRTSPQCYKIACLGYSCPRRTLTAAAAGIKDAEARVTVLRWASAAGTCPLNSPLGKSLPPCCFREVHFPPVHYYVAKRLGSPGTSFLISFTDMCQWLVLTAEQPG